MQVTDYMEPNLTQLSQTNSYADEFFIKMSPDGRHALTGAYDKTAHVIDAQTTSNIAVKCSHNAKPGATTGTLKTYGQDKRLISCRGSGHFNFHKDLL